MSTSHDVFLHFSISDITRRNAGSAKRIAKDLSLQYQEM